MALQQTDTVKLKINPNPAKRHEWRAPDGQVYPLVDIPVGQMFVIVPTAADIARAKRVDPNNCALAQAWKRMEGVPVAQIGVDKCYLPIRRKGKIVVMRGKVEPRTKEAIDHFDRTGKFPAEGFFISGIPPSEAIDSKRSRDKRERHRWTLKSRITKQTKRTIHLRNASRRAQVFVS